MSHFISLPMHLSLEEILEVEPQLATFSLPSTQVLLIYISKIYSQLLVFQNSHFFFSRGEEGPFHLHFLCVAEQTKTRDKVWTRFLFPFFTRTEFSSPNLQAAAFLFSPCPPMFPFPAPPLGTPPLPYWEKLSALCLLTWNIGFQTTRCTSILNSISLYSILYTHRYSILDSVTQLEF